jgi:hypothetical protein
VVVLFLSWVRVLESVVGLEVEVADWLVVRKVKRPIPGYETLELADEQDVFEADDVTVEGMGDSLRLVRSLVSALLRRSREAREGPILVPPRGGADSRWRAYWRALKRRSPLLLLSAAPPF